MVVMGEGELGEDMDCLDWGRFVMTTMQLFDMYSSLCISSGVDGKG